MKITVRRAQGQKKRGWNKKWKFFVAMIWGDQARPNQRRRMGQATHNLNSRHIKETADQTRCIEYPVYDYVIPKVFKSSPKFVTTNDFQDLLVRIRKSQMRANTEKVFLELGWPDPAQRIALDFQIMFEIFPYMGFHMAAAIFSLATQSIYLPLVAGGDTIEVEDMPAAIDPHYNLLRYGRGIPSSGRQIIDIFRENTTFVPPVHLAPRSFDP